MQRNQPSSFQLTRYWVEGHLLNNDDHHTLSDSSSRFCTKNSCYWSIPKLRLTLWPHGLQHARLPCTSPTPRVYSNSRQLSQWCYPTISSSAAHFSFWLQSSPASESFPVSQLFTSGGQSTGASASASALPKNMQGRFPLGLTGLISLQNKGLSRVFCSISACTLSAEGTSQ